MEVSAPRPPQGDINPDRHRDWPGIELITGPITITVHTTRGKIPLLVQPNPTVPTDTHTATFRLLSYADHQRCILANATKPLQMARSLWTTMLIETSLPTIWDQPPAVPSALLRDYLDASDLLPDEELTLKQDYTALLQSRTPLTLINPPPIFGAALDLMNVQEPLGYAGLPLRDMPYRLYRAIRTLLSAQRDWSEQEERNRKNQASQPPLDIGLPPGITLGTGRAPTLPSGAPPSSYRGNQTTPWG